jgi:signal transduction histidine kinase
VLFFVVHLSLDRLSYVDTLRPFAIMAWNPALGVSVAVVSVWGIASLPLVFAAPFVGALLIRGFPLTPVYTAFVASLAVFKTYFIWQLGMKLSKAGNDNFLKNPQPGLLLATVPVTLAAAAIHAGGLAAFHLLSGDQLGATIERLWIGDLMGIFVQLPLCLLIFDVLRGGRHPQLNAIPQTLFQISVTAGALWLVFIHYHHESSLYFFILFLPMIWIVLAHGLTGAILLNTAVQGSTISYLLLVDPNRMDLTLFQALAAVFIVSALTLGFSIDQNRKAARRLQEREEELAITLKTAATSELAGTLAHELSHPIGAIANYAIVVDDLIKRNDPEARAIFAKLRQEARRAKDTLHRLREFYRSGTMVIERIELDRAAKDSVSLLKSRMGRDDASIKYFIECEDVRLMADRVQLQGVLHNVLINAIDAIKHMPPARRVIRVKVWRDTEHGYLSVEDAGAGISPDVRDQIFEPLVTTKKNGLGLGLSTSRSIIHALGGEIECGPSDLGGAKFKISLPLAA